VTRPRVRAKTPAAIPAGPRTGDETRRQIRGSSLLLTGRLLSMAANLAIQVMIVRHLTQSEYGSFAYALSLVAFAETFVTFGLDRAVTRFVALYDEEKEPGKALGTLVMVAGTVFVLGTALAVLVWTSGGLLLGAVVDDPEAVRLLVILILLAPIQAIDSLAIGVFAVFSRPGAIFLRRYVLAPGLRIIVVLTLVLTGQGPEFLATGYVLAGLVGVLIYVPVLFRVLRQQGLLARSVRKQMHIPVKAVLAFTIPLLTSDLVYVVMNVTDVVMLGYFRDTESVGALRAILPIAKLNLFVMSSFALLYTPLAARLYSRGDRDSLDHLYWRTATWLAVLTLPVFLVGFSLAGPVTTTLFGLSYAESAAYLALLSFGYYVQAAFGFNGLTLKAIGAVRIIVVLNVAAALANILANLLLIPSFGALGAAIGTATALVVHNLFKQLGLRRETGVSLLPRAAGRVHLAALGGAAGLAALQGWLDIGLVMGLVLGAMISLGVLLLARPLLDAEGTFPELLRIAPLRFLLVGRRGGSLPPGHGE
jgi:O-antigen/teichoic acid export membrane protein